MIRYVIEKEPGLWLSDPEEIADDPTNDITKAWLFDGRKAAERVLKNLQDEECLKGWIVRDHTFVELSGALKLVSQWASGEYNPEIITVANLFRTYFQAPVTFK